jgi:hypothetical protein
LSDLRALQVIRWRVQRIADFASELGNAGSRGTRLPRESTGP